MRIRRVETLPLGELESLIAESERAGFRFLIRLRDEWISGENRFDQDSEALFIAEREGEVIGICGLNRDSYSADTRIGRVRRLYVAEGQRRRGVASSLLGELLAVTKKSFGELVLRTEDPVADAFFRSFGYDAHREDSHSHRIAI